MSPAGLVPPLLEAVFAGLADGVCVSDGGRILSVNDEASRLLGPQARPGGGLPLCALLCARLASAERPDHAEGCPLLDARDPRRAVTFAGRLRDSERFQWGAKAVSRIPLGPSLRVRCLRLRGTELEGREGLHLTLIEEMPAAARPD